MSRIELTISARDQASRVLSGIGNAAVGLNAAFSVASSVAGALSGAFKSVVDEGSAFQKQMSQVKSVANITAKEFNALSGEAKKIGATTAFTASEAAKGFEVLKRAGFSTGQVIKNTAAIMDFASAQNTSIEKSAKSAALALNIYKDSGLDARQAVDIMNKSLGAADVEFDELKEAIANSIGTAKASGLSFQELNEVLAVFHNTGTKGAEAGTALASTLGRMSNPTKDMIKAYGELGLSMDEVDPKTTKFKDILLKLQETGASQSQIFRIFGTEMAKKLIPIVNDASKQFGKFNENLENTKTASESAADQLDNFDGKIKLLSSAFSGLKIAIFEKLEKPLSYAVDKATEWVGAITGFLTKGDGIKKVAESTEKMAKASKNASKDVKTFASSMGEAVKKSDELDNSLVGNSSVPAVLDMGKASKSSKEQVDSFGISLGLATKFSDKLDKSLSRVAGKGGSRNAPFGGSSPATSATGIDLSGISVGGTVKGQAVGASQQIVGVSGGIEGFKTGGAGGAVVGALTEILLANKKMQALIGKINETIIELLDPIIEAVVPIVDALLPFIKFTKPIFKAIGAFIKEMSPPLLSALELIKSLLPNLSEIVKWVKISATVGTMGIVPALMEVMKWLKTLVNVFVPFTQEIGGGVGGAGEGGGITGKITKGLSSFTASFSKQSKEAMKNTPFAKPKSFIDMLIDRLKEIFGNIDFQPIIEKIDEIVGVIKEKFDLVIGRLDFIYNNALIVIKTALANIIIAIDYLTGVYIKTIGRIVEKIDEAVAVLKSAIDFWLSGISEAISVVSAVLYNISSGVLIVIDWLKYFWDNGIKHIVGSLKIIIDWLKYIFDEGVWKIVENVKAVASNVKLVIDWIKYLWDYGLKPLKDGVDKINRGVKLVLEWLKYLWDYGLKPIELSARSLSLMSTYLYNVYSYIKNIDGNIIGAVNNLNSIISLLSGGGAVGGALDKAKSAVGFHEGGVITSGDLLRLPGMNRDEGLIKAQTGERVISRGDQGESVNIVINVQSIDPRSQKEEIRELMEELFLTRRLQVA